MNRIRLPLIIAGLSLLANTSAPAAPAPLYIWFEPEWFEGVEGETEYYHGGERLARVLGHWGRAGPGVSAEWTQGGESEWNSMGAGPNETNAVCRRDFFVPRAGRYKVWVRYYDHRDQAEPFAVRIEQNGKSVLAGELGTAPVVPPNDEYLLYWGFSFGWGAVDGKLAAGPATLKVVANKRCDTWRQVDAVLITDDLDYQPVMREKPPFAYFAAFDLQPANGAAWRGSGKHLTGSPSHKRPGVAGRDFTMWTAMSTAGAAANTWWAEQDVAALTPYELQFRWAPGEDIREAFYRQFAGRQDVPIVSWENLVMGFRLGSPDLSAGSPLRRWLDRTKSPFFILSNNSGMRYNATNGPATFAALTGPLAGQFLGYIHGESIGSEELRWPAAPLGATRREHVDALGAYIKQKDAAIYSAGYHTDVPESYRATAIACLSGESITTCHLMHELGAKLNGYEVDGTCVHTPMRIAYARGAARQYGAGWLHYASGNFADACNYFAQDPIVPRGAKGWFHSKYAVTDGVPITWYRSLYYLNYLSGASAVFWEQYLMNQWIKPGPGEHPVQLSPYGRATADFQAFADRLPDRGEPYTPVAVLLSYGHGYDPYNYMARMLRFFTENDADRELRELYNVFWFPAPVREGQPATPHVQNLMAGRYGNIFDVLVDRPDRLDLLADYPIVWAAGDVALGGPVLPALQDYLKRGGTLVVNAAAAKDNLPAALLGLRFKSDRERYETWRPADGESLACAPYQLERVELAGATPLAYAAGEVPLVTRHQVGEGAVICVLIPRGTGYDERAHPSLPWLVNGLTQDLLPVAVSPAEGSVMYQLNKTRDGWLVGLFNGRGVDKTQHGIARVDRTAVADVTLRTKRPVGSAKEWTQPRALPATADGVRVRVHPGDVQVVELITE